MFSRIHRSLRINLRGHNITSQFLLVQRTLQTGTNFCLFQCWKCGTRTADLGLFCHQCNSLQKPDNSKNYFELLGIRHGYRIQDKELTTKFRKLQNVLHPDRFTSKSEDEREISQQYSSLVNKAYTTLLHPMRRGFYMLQLQGVQLEEDNTQSNPKFLAEIMETNEELAEAQSKEDIQRLEKNNKEVLSLLVSELEKKFDEGDIKAAKDVLIRMKYYSSIEGRIKELKQKLGIEG